MLEEFGVKILKACFPKKFSITLGKRSLNMLAKSDKSGEVSRLLETVERPKLDIAYKMQGNYAIASFRLRDKATGRTVGRVAASADTTGAKQVKTLQDLKDNIAAVETNPVKMSANYADKDGEIVHISLSHDATHAAKPETNYYTEKGNVINAGSSDGVSICNIHVSNKEKAEDLARKLAKGDKEVEESWEALNKLRQKAIAEGQNPAEGLHLENINLENL